MTATGVVEALRSYANPQDALFSQSFFKTGAGQYGEGDVFIGVRVPQTRSVCKQFASLPLDEVQKLLDSEVHEHRLAGLIILATAYAKATEPVKDEIYNFYVTNVRTHRVNNWDLVDSSAPYIIGPHLQSRPRDLLFELAKSDNLWERRVAILSTFDFIKHGDPSTTLEIAELLLRDKEDLIHKAVGWMLRELGKKVDVTLLTDFLKKHAAIMPRTMLRYAIEHLPLDQRRHYMRMKSDGTVS